MAVHNQLDTLSAALNSIVKQTFTDWELILVSDGSDMETENYLKQFAQKHSQVQLIINSRHIGLTKSLNKGLKEAKGKYLARMDADDVCLPDRLKQQVAYLEDHQEIALLGTAAYLMNDQGKNVGLKRFPSDNKSLRAAALHHCPFIHPTWMARTSVLRELAGYNEQFPFAQDYELALRLMAKHQVANLAEPLLIYRVNSPEAISLKNLKKQESLAIKARLMALTQYGYPLTDAWKLFKPFLSYLIPASLKRIIYRRFFW
jgi:glycosyltransferase involved in cell wall biosynthesis